MDPILGQKSKIEIRSNLIQTNPFDSILSSSFNYFNFFSFKKNHFRKTIYRHVSNFGFDPELQCPVWARAFLKRIYGCWKWKHRCGPIRNWLLGLVHFIHILDWTWMWWPQLMQIFIWIWAHAKAQWNVDNAKYWAQTRQCLCGCVWGLALIWFMKGALRAGIGQKCLEVSSFG